MASCTALNGVLIGRTLVDLSHPLAVVRLLNLTGKRRKLRKGTEVAQCELVESVQLPQKEGREEGSGTVELPDHLRELFERSASGLTADQRQHLRSLLLRYSHVFSVGPHDLGKTDLAKHSIDTQGATPIRQPPRRLPFA